MSVFCIISDVTINYGKGSVTIECGDKTLASRRGIKCANFRLTHPCYEVSSAAMKRLLLDGYKELSQDDYCRVFSIHTGREDK